MTDLITIRPLTRMCKSQICTLNSSNVAFFILLDYSVGAVCNKLRSMVTSHPSSQTEEKYAIVPSIDCISKDLKTNSSAYGLEREWSIEIEIIRARSIKTPLRRPWSHPNKQLNLPRHERKPSIPKSITCGYSITFCANPAADSQATPIVHGTCDPYNITSA